MIEMFGKIKSVKELASTALGKVEITSKVLPAPKAPEKEEPCMETPVCEAEDKVEVKEKLLSKLAVKKAEVEETETNEPHIVTESEETEVKKVPEDETKAMKAKAIAAAKKTDADETELK